MIIYNSLALEEFKLQRSCARVAAGGDAAMQARVLTPSDAVTQLQTFEPIQPPRAFHVHDPAFAAQQHSMRR